ncbi:MAG: restriction endonuclease subunit S [Coriobacteriia bacterium]|nr:restriction endonuclease subunit S [Coriobacteriia bacterium]
MSRIDELIAELCPDGVEHKTLGELGIFARGNGLQKKDLRDSGVPAIHYGQVHTHYGIWTTETKSFVTPEFAARLRKAEPGDLVIATTSEDDEAVAKAVAWLGFVPAAVSGDAYIYQHSLDPKYVAYFFQSERFQEQKKRGITGTKVRRISGDSLAKIRIPVPPSEIQREIVRILDLFTTLEAELEAELEARRRQYAHYRDSLLTFPEGGVRWVPMGEVGTIFGGLTGKSKADFSDGNARFISYVNVFNNIAADMLADDRVRVGPSERQRALQRGDVLFTGSSETVDEVAMSSVITADVPEPVYLNSFCIGYRLNETGLLDPDFAKHLFRSAGMRGQLIRTASGVTRFNVSKQRLAKVRIPIPEVGEQRRIAGVLDKLDALVNDLSVGLPAELAARRKQYEYYRDQVLTFKEAAA